MVADARPRSPEHVTAWVDRDEATGWRAGFRAVSGAWYVHGEARRLDRDGRIAVEGTGGALAITKLVIELDPDAFGAEIRTYPPGGITASALRDIPLGAIVSKLRTVIGSSPADIQAIKTRAVAQGRKERAKSGAEKNDGRKPGRPRLEDSFYRSIAVEFLELDAERTAGKMRGGIHRTIADRHGVAEDTSKAWCRKAKMLGFLEQGKQGQRRPLAGQRLIKEGWERD